VEAWGYIVVGLVLLLLVFVANLIRVVIRHRRIVREAHRARASSMLQGAARYLDRAPGQPDAGYVAPVDFSLPAEPFAARDVTAVDATDAVERVVPAEAGDGNERVVPAEPAASVARPDFVLPEVRRGQERPLVPVPPFSTFESDFGLAQPEPRPQATQPPAAAEADVHTPDEVLSPGEPPGIHEAARLSLEAVLDARREDLGEELPPISEAPETSPVSFLGRALSTVVPPESVLQHAETVSAEIERPASAPTPGVSESYSLVAPVELHFSGGGARVGVRDGTPLQAEFLRIANLLLDDLAVSHRG